VCSGCGRPHNSHPTAKINKVKALALIFWSVSLPHQYFIFCQKHLQQAFLYVICFIHIHLNPDKTQLLWIGTRQQLFKATVNDAALSTGSLGFSSVVSNLGVPSTHNSVWLTTSRPYASPVSSSCGNSVSFVAAWPRTQPRRFVHTVRKTRFVGQTVFSKYIKWI